MKREHTVQSKARRGDGRSPSCQRLTRPRRENSAKPKNSGPSNRIAICISLLAWHEGDPVGEYERHRNLAIAELQGNRNPLIDHGDWARRIDFAGAWG